MGPSTAGLGTVAACAVAAPASPALATASATAMADLMANPPPAGTAPKSGPAESNARVPENLLGSLVRSRRDDVRAVDGGDARHRPRGGDRARAARRGARPGRARTGARAVSGRGGARGRRRR